MRTSKRVVLFCVLFLLFLSFKPLQAYGISLFSGLEVANSQKPQGAKVFAIKENSPALQSDFRINDVITSIEGQPVSSLEDFVRISTALKDKEGVSLSVHRWGKVFEIALGKKSVGEQAKPETRVQAEPPPKQVGARTAQKDFKNPVVPNATGITYRHGQYPSEGNNTHPGIDIVADCGTPIYAFAEGQVTDLIKDAKDPHFKFLGYMVIIKHLESIYDKDTYSTYLHMAEPPAVSKGQTVKAGDVIGKVGDTGNAKGCHVHFELRHFPDRFLNDKGWNYPLNIYGKGDQRNEKRFLDNWEDPELYFSKYPGGIVSQEKKLQGETKIAEGERIEDYFSIQNGARWEYQGEAVIPEKTLLFGIKHTKWHYKVIAECREGVNFRGHKALMFLEEHTTSIGSYRNVTTLKRYFGKENDTLLFLGYEHISKQGTAEYIFEPPLVLLREPIMTNSGWDIASSKNGLSIRGRVVIESKEKVSTSAGSFDAIKLVSRTNLGEVTEWYAKGMGLVRKVEVAEVEGLGKETKKYELVSYFLGGLLVSKTVEENTKSETKVKQKAGVTTPKKGDSLLDKEAVKWMYTDPETGVRFASSGMLSDSQVNEETVAGEVPLAIDLANHEVAKRLLERAKEIWLEKSLKKIEGANPWTAHYTIYIGLYAGSLSEDGRLPDVAALLEGEIFSFKMQGLKSFQTEKGRQIYICGFTTLMDYVNKASVVSFVKKYKIAKVLEPKMLFTNPFQYKGERIAIYLPFNRMVSENEAMFCTFTTVFMVSGVPSNVFTRGNFTLAARVLGVTENKGGEIAEGYFKTVPHLEYLGHESRNLTVYIAEVLKEK